MTDISPWTSRHPPRNPPGEAHDAPLLLLGCGEAQSEAERAQYHALLSKREALRDALKGSDARIRGVVILPFTAQGPGSDRELQRQGYGAQALILTALPGYDPAMQALTARLRDAATECPMYVSAYAGPTIPGHILRGGVNALIAPEDAGTLDAFLQAHQPPTPQNIGRIHGLR